MRRIIQVIAIALVFFVVVDTPGAVGYEYDCNNMLQPIINRIFPSIC